MHCFSNSGEGAELLIGYAARSLPPAAEAVVEAHLAQCEACRDMAESQRLVWSAMEAWDTVPVSPGFDEKVFDQIAADRGSPWYRRIFDAGIPWRHAMPVAAACAALLVILVIRFPGAGDSPEFPSASRNVDIEQVERTLDDLDMLTQMGIVPSASTAPNGSS